MPSWETLTEVLPGLGTPTGERRCGACGALVREGGEYCADCADDLDAAPDIAAASDGPPGAA